MIHIYIYIYIYIRYIYILISKYLHMKQFVIKIYDLQNRVVILPDRTGLHCPLQEVATR